MKNKLIIYFLLIFTLFSCSKDDTNQNPLSISIEAKNFLNEILDIMERNSINRNEIEWEDFRNKVFEEVKEAQTISDTYPGIRKALELLGDNHSFFLKAEGGGISASTVNCNSPSISTPLLPNNIGYVKVNSFNSSNVNEGINFAKEIQQQIKSDDSSRTVGWIVDLRGNLGGNMFPMLAGIGPILGEGIAGYFIDPNGSSSFWSFLNGASRTNNIPNIQISDSYTLITPNPRVAVLLDNGVASSGEAIAVSFIDRENTKSFGSTTCGLSTGNSNFVLSNNSTLILTTTYMADRNQKLYGVPIEPDMISNNENIIQDAINWIEN